MNQSQKIILGGFGLAVLAGILAEFGMVIYEYEGVEWIILDQI